jgi:hypothetical protein
MLLGVWKRPKPMPQRASRHTTSHFAGVVGKKTIRSRPAARNAKPRLEITDAGWRVVMRPAMGAVTAVMSGQGVRRKPVSTAERCILVSNKIGSET